MTPTLHHAGLLLLRTLPSAIMMTHDWPLRFQREGGHRFSVQQAEINRTALVQDHLLRVLEDLQVVGSIKKDASNHALFSSKNASRCSEEKGTMVNSDDMEEFGNWVLNQHS